MLPSWKLTAQMTLRKALRSLAVKEEGRREGSRFYLPVPKLTCPQSPFAPNICHYSVKLILEEHHLGKERHS